MSLRLSALNAIAAGHATVTDLAAHLNERPYRIRNAVCRLQELGVVRRSPDSLGARTARYEPTGVAYTATARVAGQRAAATLLAKVWPESTR